MAYFSGVSSVTRYVNYFNQDDYALALWELNQSLKPDNRNLINTPTISREYAYSAGSDFHVVKRVLQPTGVIVSSVDRLLSPSVDKFEIFTMVAEARCWATGAQPDLRGSFITADQVNLKQRFNFGSASADHSGEFNSAIQLRYPFWKQLLDTFDITVAYPLSP